MRVSVPASKLIFEQTPRWASGLLRILQHSELTDEAEGRFGVGLLFYPAPLPDETMPLKRVAVW